MSIEGKQLLVKDLIEGLSARLTMTDINIVTEVITNVLPYYDVEMTGCDESQNDFDQLLKAFIDAKRIEGRSEKTIERYRYILNRFHEAEPFPMQKMTVFSIRHYLGSEKERGISDRTLRGYRDIFQSFFGWLYREGLISSNPCGNLNTIKCKKEVRTPYSEVDIEKLKEACSSQRDKALITFLLATGCRISEVCSLDRNDVDFANMQCTVLGKGNKERTVYLDSVATMQLRQYLVNRKDKSDALFVGKGSARLHPGGIRKRLNELGNAAGVENVHPHRFRRTLATNLINHGMPIQEVASILGHDNINTTMTYVYVNSENVKNAYRKYA